MDRKIILPLLVASAVIGCLSVQINVPQDDHSFFPGFLLYLSGNLEAGSTASAYIETNFTDPFEARLDFVHSYEDRHFFGEARIVNGSGVIEFEVPDVNYWYGTVNFTGIMEGSRQMFTSPKTSTIYIYQQSQRVTFIETDKPLYKPGQEVKFRLLTIDSQFKPETSNVPKIQIESPSQIRLEQWRDVERPDGLVDLSFQLISEPALGEYAIKAYINDAWVRQPFKVEEYVLPKVEVTVNAPSFVLITATEYSFQVCAKYTYGQPVRGSVSGEVGKLRKDYFYYYRRRPNPVLGGDEEEPDVELIDAIPFSGELDSEGCLESSVSRLNLSSYDTPYYRYSLAVRATVVEATTGDEFTEVADATKLETVPLSISLESPESFKPGISYHGRIKVTYPDGKPAPNEPLNITATVDRQTAYTGDHTSDSEGIVEFDIPYAVVDKSISLQVEAKDYPYQYNPYGYNIYSPTTRFNLDPSYSPTGRYLQIAPIFHSVNAGDELTFQVLYTSDDEAVTSDFKVQLISRNKLVNVGATQEGGSRRRRAVASEGLTQCLHQAQEAEEKGDQSSFVPACEEDGSFSRQQCMPSINRCWCVNPENGIEIPMTSRQSPEEFLDCEDNEEEGPIEVPIGELGPPDVFNQCPEGFKFGDGVKKCVRETECERQVREVTGKGLLGARTPTCDEAGNFMLEQCHGSSGYCWCVDTVTGLELLGTKTGPTENNTDCDAFIARQETECQRQVREATGKGLLGAQTPVCDEDGNFMLEQCHGSSGYCWCVDTLTGVELPGTKTGPTEENTDCEAFIAIEETECQRQVREVTGKGLLGAPTPECDEDGNFMLEQCHGSSGYCWCVDTGTGVELPGTKTGPTEENTDCQAFIAIEETECQRQVREVTGKGLLGARTPVCDEAGNFMLEQCHGSSGYCWCVDTVTGLELPGTKTGPTENNTDCEAFIARQETECQRQLREVEMKGLALGAWRPNCDEDGNFMPEQCHGSSGYCWCVDILTGLEIPETETGPTEENVDCEAVTPAPTLKLQTLEPITLVLRTPEPVVHVDPQALHEVSFTVPITAGMSPEAKLLVYYTSPEGEVVADSVNIKINEAFENEVKLEFLDEQVLPGSETTLKVSAANGSLCGIGIVDKSVYVLGGENKLTPKKLFSAFDLSTRTTYDDGDCPSRWFRFRKKRDIIFPGFFGSTVNYVDSSEAFSNTGLKAITNYDLNVAPCVYRTPEVVAYSVFNADLVDETEFRTGAGSTPKEDKVRSYFPSTWLWSLQRISNAEVEVPLTVPHTITDWIANGLCTNVEKGLGVSPPVVLRAFQSFFLSMSLPYSIIRTEKTPVKVTVFNYLDQCLVVRVTLEENEDFVLSGSNEFTVAVPAGEATTVTYKVAAFVLGSIPLQVSAKSISDDEFLCGNEAVAGPAGVKDTVLIDLKVKPEGEQETTTESAYFCLEEDETYNKHVSLKIPPQHVLGTAVGEISVTGDLVGNTLSNVESMLRMPYGCGEQNLVSMVPNIVALQYLESVGEATPEITAEAKKYILSGYQRELNYRRSDNSYSAFGESNPSGSTFLTAFVVRTYAHAQRFVDIDEDDLDVTVQWLRSIQNVDGSFRTVGYLAHKAMKGGVNNNVTLAAYMVATFLEAGYDSQDETVAAALAYIDSQLDTLEDTYSMALLAYAYALAGSDRFDDVYKKLQELAVESEGMKHWESNRDLPEYASYYQDSSKAQNIEMTAYVLRAMVHKEIPNLEVEGSVIARWLVSQRNPRGGFSSTQDTVIGLTALAEFSSLGTSENSDLTLTMNIRGGSTLQFDVDYDNRFIVQKGSFEDFPAEISVSAEGQGCALYSISGDYYIKRDKQTLDPFTLDVKAKAQEPKARKRRDAHEGEEHEHEYEEEEVTCEKFTISVSARYNGEDGASNMAIINFRPVSGFAFDKESLEAMLAKYSFVKRYEINEDIITFYFDEITNENIEFEFDVTKEFDVEDAKPAFMNILDYYENGLKVAEEFEFVCADDVLTSSPSTTYTTPPSPSGFASSSSTMTPDYDECAIPEVCGGPEYQCVNYPGTYECICAEGYALDEDEENCVEVPSCPMCNGDGLPLGVNELICASDSIHVMKVRGDGSFRPLNDLRLNEDILERKYYDVEMNEACTCDVISIVDRIIVVASSDHIGASSGKRNERVLLDEDVVIVPSVSKNKKDIKEILDGC